MTSGRPTHQTAVDSEQTPVHTHVHNTCIVYTFRYTTPALCTLTGTQHLYYVHSQIHNTCIMYSHRYTTPVLCTHTGT